jgi:hypothetical protein
VGIRFKNSLLISVAFFLIAVIEAPSVIKLWHSLYSHTEITCDQEGKTHFHSAEIDCDFHKFNITLHYFLPQIHFEANLVRSFREDHFDYYSSVSLFQSHQYTLRGPPASA